VYILSFLRLNQKEEQQRSLEAIAPSHNF